MAPSDSSLPRRDMSAQMHEIGAKGRRILIVEASYALPTLMQGVTGASVVITRFATLTAELMSRVEPDTVIAPVFGKGFDILDLAGCLYGIGYGGQLRGLSGALPRPQLITAEIRSHWPMLDFDMIELPAGILSASGRHRRR